jgi:CRP/FNR family cyclic AMP-dependent transcriptional regulator
MLESMGKLYRDGEYIVREGEIGNCMYVIQSGEVEVVRRAGDKEFSLALLGEGEFFGEMALFDREVRSASVRTVGEVWVLTLEKKSFLRHVRQDPSLAFRILEKMAKRIRSLDSRFVNMGTSFVDEARRSCAVGE